MARSKNTYGPVRVRNLGIVAQSTLGATPITCEAKCGGYTEVAFAIGISNYSSVTQIQATFEFSYDGGITWYAIADDDTGGSLLLTKALTSSQSWVWTVKARAQIVRMTMIATNPGGEDIIVSASSSSAPIKATAPVNSSTGPSPNRRS